MTRSPRFDASSLLDWYDGHGRALPWRTGPRQRAAGVVPDPYHVWLSEIMLQQTTVAAVGPYFREFLQRWPSLNELAAAKTDDVMAAWAGLGYYSRARNLKKSAETLVEAHRGSFPRDEETLRTLPGIGPYTAAAIAAIAFDRPATVVDGNVERVVSRLFAVETPLPDAKPELRRLAATLTPKKRPGDFAQAMMDLGATICTPRKPACALCPVDEACSAFRSDIPERFPIRRLKKQKPLRLGAAFVAVRNDGAILLRRRPPKGLLGGMTEVPTTEWSQTHQRNGAAVEGPFDTDWAVVSDPVRHVFTHFRLELDVFRAEVANSSAPNGHWWAAGDTLADAALPTVMRKVLAVALGRDTGKKRR